MSTGQIYSSQHANARKRTPRSRIVYNLEYNHCNDYLATIYKYHENKKLGTGGGPYPTRPPSPILKHHRIADYLFMNNFIVFLNEPKEIIIFSSPLPPFSEHLLTRMSPFTNNERTKCEIKANLKHHS